MPCKTSYRIVIFRPRHHLGRLLEFLPTRSNMRPKFHSIYKNWAISHLRWAIYATSFGLF